ncbi:MAG: polyprenyl synthetase family protein [Clostridia bacterium]|nr:polyprenyl synthetase family protein [Clostridia bacterium]
MWGKYTEIKSELDQVEELIKESITSRNNLLSEIVKELLQAGGKRLRPAFVILSAKFGKYNRKKVLPLAGAFEVLHTATLVHDDVIDCSKMRRGKVTVHEKYGVDMAVYTGDFLFTKAVLMLSKGVPADKLDIVATAIKTICEGEVDQYQGRYNANTTVLAYLKRISRKTAVLFSAACSLGAFTAKCSPGTIRRLAKFGFCYGMAFQLRDDLNDFLCDASKTGKPAGNDIAKGVMTLPAIYALNKNDRFREILDGVMTGKKGASEEELAHVVDLITKNGGIDYTRSVLEAYIERGLRFLEGLPENSYKAAFKELIEGLAV